MVKATVFTAILLIALLVMFNNMAYAEEKPLVLNFFEFGKTSKYVCTVNKQHKNEIDCVEQRRKYEGAEFFKRLMGQKL